MDNSNIELYESDDGKLRINVRLDQETVWLSQQQLSELFGSSRTNVVEHIKHIYQEGELDKAATCRNFRQVQLEGGRNVSREIPFYNLDMIISLGYRINSKIATAFRQWATQKLKEYIVKGFTLDDERLKQNGDRYFKELLQRIRDIRSSERNLWQQVTDIFATSIDYDSNSQLTKDFFAIVQNKMHYAVHRQTAAEVIYNRVDSEKPMIGMTNFKGDYITKEDTHIAKNYLKEDELLKLNLLVEQYLGYAELQAIREIPMHMQDWKDELDNELKHLNFGVLQGSGKISHKQACEKADTEYDKYRKKELANYESDFDKAIKELDIRIRKLKGKQR